MAKMKALVCRECGKEYPTEAIHVCELCFGPLEVKYNYDEIKAKVSRESIEAGPRSLWRYQDFLPIEGKPTVGISSGANVFAAQQVAKDLGPGKNVVTVLCDTLSRA